MKPTQADIDRAAFLKRQKEKALIAAAPDLLSAARNAANVLAALATGQIAAIKPDSNALKELRSAIAKAEGVK